MYLGTCRPLFRGVRTLVAIALLAAGTALTGCGSDSSEEASSTTQPTMAETATCRSQAKPVIAALKQALNDKDVRDVAGRVDTVRGMLPAATAQCSEAVARPVRIAFDTLDSALRDAINGKSIGDSLATVATKLDQASTALQATK